MIKILRRSNFFHFVQVYRGYVDDPRNTDNAWMETVAINFHDELGTGLARFPLVAGMTFFFRKFYCPTVRECIARIAVIDRDLHY